MDVWMGLIFPSAISFAPYGSVYCQGQTMAISQNTALFSLLGTTFGGDGSQTFGIPDLRGRVAVGIGAGPGLTPVVLGQKFGTSSVTLVANNLPAHNHPATFTPTIGSAPISITVGSGGSGLNANVAAAPINGTLTVSTNPGTTNTPSSTNVPAQVPGIVVSTTVTRQVSAYGSAASPATANWPVGGASSAQSAPVNGTIAGNANTVTGGSVTVGNNVTANTPVAITPPSLGLAYIIMTTGIYPPRP